MTSVRLQYDDFIKKHPEYKLSYTEYRKYLSAFNDEIANSLLIGEQYDLGENLGILFIRVIERNFNRKTVDFFRTRLYKKTIYYSDDYYLKFDWLKPYNFKHKKHYKFKVTKGTNGLSRRLAKILKEDPNIKNSFIWFTNK